MYISRSDRWLLNISNATELIRCYEQLRKDIYGSTRPISRNEFADFLDSFLCSNLADMTKRLNNYATPSQFHSSYNGIGYHDQGPITNATLWYRTNPIEFFVDALTLLPDSTWNKEYTLYPLNSMYAQVLLKAYREIHSNDTFKFCTPPDPTQDPVEYNRRLHRADLIVFFSELLRPEDSMVIKDHVIERIDNFQDALNWAKKHPASVFCYVDPDSKIPE